MNQRIDFAELGGFPLTQGVTKFMQDSYRNALGAIANVIGDKCILYGVQVQGGNVTDGWISVGGELIPFQGGTVSSGVVIQETGENLSFFGGVLKTVKFTKVAFCGSPATFAFSDLHRPQTFRDSWLTGDIKQVDCSMDYLNANFDLSSGLGLNERLGWAICDGRNSTRDRRGRFSVGWDNRTINPGIQEWDAIYNSLGNLGGEKLHQLLKGELPSFSLRLQRPNGDFYYNDTNSGGGLFSLKGDNDNSNGNGAITTESIGSNLPHENRPPFLVTLFIQKL